MKNSHSDNAHSDNALPDHALPDHDQTSQNASLSAPLSTPLSAPSNARRLPRETIPAKDAEAAAEASIETAEPVGARNAALWISLFVLATLGLFSLGSWSGRRSSQPPTVGPIANRVLVVKPLVVHVAGEVKKPGVYTLKNGARVFDALQKAGGATSVADANALNLAAPAEDGAKIEVPRKTQTPPKLAQKLVVVEDLNESNEKSSDVAPEISAPETPELDAKLPFASEAAAAQLPVKRESKRATSSTRSVKNVSAKREKPTAKKPRAKKEKSKTIAGLPRALTPSGKLSNNASPEFLTKNPLDLNRITQEQLEALPGVGPSLAGRVLEYRKQNGGFQSVDELDNVKGIGEKKLNDLRPLLRVEGEKFNASAKVIEPKTSVPYESKP